MKKKVSFQRWVLLAALFVLTGCGGEAALTTPTPTPTLTPALLWTSTPSPTPGAAVIPAATPAGQASPAPLCGELELELDYRQVQQAEGFFAEMTAQGRIPLSLNPHQTPPRVEGKGEALVGGGGQAGDCSFTYSGSLEYDLHGELLLDRQPPVIALSGRRGARNLSAAGEGCYGGLFAPVFTEDVPLFEIEYREGAVVKYSFEVPTFHGQAVWTLHFRCP